jgi:Histone methylation protein DOT1
LTDALQRFVGKLEADLTLLMPNRVQQRLDALDRLDAYFPEIAQAEIDDLEHAPEIDAAAIDTLDAAGLARRARSVRDRLENSNQELFKAIRDQVRRGAGRLALLQWTESSPQHADAAPGMGFDFRDDLISGLLQLEQPAVGQFQLAPEMVFYQPTPARHIFNLLGLSALAAGDVFVDIGSGLGHVPLLISICTDARAIGIELESAYVECARQCAERLNLDRVAFFEQDARVADYSSGTVFYLYTPFSGAMLQLVLDRLKQEAACRQIRICTYGPSTSVIAQQPWLRATSMPDADRITVFRSSH